MIVERITQNADVFPWEYSSSRPLAEPQTRSSQNDEDSQNSLNTNPTKAPQTQIPEDRNHQVEAVGGRNDLNSRVNEEQTENQEPVGLLPTTNTQCEKSHN